MSGLYFADAKALEAALSRVLGLHDLGTELIAAQVFEQESASSAAICTCPSGDGSLRWPCPIHLPDSWSVHVDEYDDGTGRAIIAGPGCWHMEVPVYGSMLDFMKAVSAPSSTSNATQKGWKSAPENADETMIAEGNIMAKAMLDSVHILDVSLIYAAMLAVVSKPVISEPVDDLVMQIRRLVHSLKKHNPDSKLVLQVMDYMKRNGYFKATDCLRANGDEGTNHVD